MFSSLRLIFFLKNIVLTCGYFHRSAAHITDVVFQLPISHQHDATTSSWKPTEAGWYSRTLQVTVDGEPAILTVRNWNETEANSSSVSSNAYVPVTAAKTSSSTSTSLADGCTTIAYNEWSVQSLDRFTVPDPFWRGATLVAVCSTRLTKALGGARGDGCTTVDPSKQANATFQQNLAISYWLTTPPVTLCPFTAASGSSAESVHCTRIPKLILGDMIGAAEANSYHVNIPPITACPAKTMPTYNNATATLPNGYGILGNISFRTSCGHADTKCYATCTRAAIACSMQWQAWTDKNLFVVEIARNASTIVKTTAVRSYSFSPSVLDGVTFEYAIGSGVPQVITTTSYQHSREHSVMRWTNQPPSCTPSNWLSCTKGPDCRQCTVNGGTVQLLFWPPEVTSRSGLKVPAASIRDGSNIAQITAAVASPERAAQTAMLGNRTLTSPSVYISFETAFATNDCGQTLGQAYPGALLPLNPDSLFSIQGQHDYFVATTDGHLSTFYQSAQFNFNDVTGLVQASAYTAQPSCFAAPHGCYTIYPDYSPVLVLPPEIRGLDPAWKSCALDWHGAWDPPVALTPQEVMASVTEPSVLMTTAATPQGGISSPAQRTDPVRTTEALSTKTLDLATYSVLPQPTAHTSSVLSPDENTASEPIGAPGALQSADEPEAATVPIISHDASPASPSQPAEQMSATIVSAFNAVPTAVPKATSSEDLTATKSADTIPSPLPEQSPEATHETGVPTSASNIDQTTVQVSPTNALDVLTQAQQSALFLTPGFTGPPVEASIGTSPYIPIPSDSRGVGTSDPPPEAANSLQPSAAASSDANMDTGTSTATANPNMMSGDTAVQMLSSLAALLVPLGSLTLTAVPLLPTNDGTEVGLSLGTQTLAVDGDPVTFSGYTLNALPNGISVDGTVIQYSDLSAAPVASTSAIAATLALTLGGSPVFTASRASDGAIQLDSQTLSPGGPAAILAEHTLSAAPYGVVLDGTTTATFQTAKPTISTRLEAILLSLDPSETLTATQDESRSDSDNAPGWIVGGQTLVPGGSALVISSHTFSVASGKILEDGTKVSYPSINQASGQAGAIESLGGIMDGFLPAVETAKAVFTTGASTSYPVASTFSQIASTTEASAAAVRSEPSLKVWLMSILCVFLVAIV
ncbi:hypothetical protein LTR17_012904 [Elasticomyces elasticus]|nr:hypothetical protein LTR17_012904 [Elasticomyces elasticus]